MNYDKVILNNALLELTKHYTKRNKYPYLVNNVVLEKLIKKTFNILNLNIKNFIIRDWCLIYKQQCIYLGYFLNDYFIEKLENFIESLKPKYIVHKDTGIFYEVLEYKDTIKLKTYRYNKEIINTITEKDLDNFYIIDYE